MKSAVVFALVTSAIVCLYLSLLLGVLEPGPPEDRTRKFTQGDSARLDRDFPGGHLLNDQTYVYCWPAGNDARLGRVVWVMSDGSTKWWNSVCWVAER